MGRKRRVAAAAFLLVMGATLANADPAVTDAGNRKAYAYAMKCFVASTSAASFWDLKKNKANAEIYGEKARIGFDAAVKLGRVMGLRNEQINHDFNAMMKQETPKLVSTAGYMPSVIAACTQLGLM